MSEDTTPKIQIQAVPQRIVIDIHGQNATINVSGLEPLQVIMLLSQFIGMAASELKKGQSKIVVPGLIVK